MSASLQTEVLETVVDRYMCWTIRELASPEYAVMLEYPIGPQVRHGGDRPAHAALSRLLASSDDAIMARSRARRRT